MAMCLQAMKAYKNLYLLNKEFSLCRDLIPNHTMQVFNGE